MSTNKFSFPYFPAMLAYIVMHNMIMHWSYEYVKFACQVLSFCNEFSFLFSWKTFISHFRWVFQFSPCAFSPIAIYFPKWSFANTTHVCSLNVNSIERNLPETKTTRRTMRRKKSESYKKQVFPSDVVPRKIHFSCCRTKKCLIVIFIRI